MISNPDTEAMLRLQAGDDLALNELMTRWQKPVVAFVYRQLGDMEESYDLAQETFVRVFESLHRWQRRHPTVSLAAENSEAHEFPAEGTPFDSAHSSEMAAAVRQQIQALPFDLRTAILLFEYEEMSHQEIAEVLGCTPKAVETRLYRARNILRESLAKLTKP